LAAARIKALSTAQILERLERSLPLLTGGARDLPERQRTLHATIAWSYDLLTPDEQRLFARFAVFVGGCTLESAEDVTEADLDTLLSLVDKSLLRHTEERIWMLEPIHEYATEHLLDADSQPTQARAKALTGAAHLAPETSVGVETFKRRAEEALALYRQLGDPWGIAYAELQFAMAVAFEGDFAVAQPLVEESV